MKDSDVLSTIKSYKRNEEENAQMGQEVAGRFSVGVGVEMTVRT